jgi:hypothetical protein
MALLLLYIPQTALYAQNINKNARNLAPHSESCVDLTTRRLNRLLINKSTGTINKGLLQVIFKNLSYLKFPNHFAANKSFLQKEFRHLPKNPLITVPLNP